MSSCSCSSRRSRGGHYRASILHDALPRSQTRAALQVVLVVVVVMAVVVLVMVVVVVVVMV